MPYICDHTECSDPAAEGMKFCPRHLEELQLLLAAAAADLRCQRCGAHVTEGLLWHQCDAPGPQPDPMETV